MCPRIDGRLVTQRFFNRQAPIWNARGTAGFPEGVAVCHILFAESQEEPVVHLDGFRRDTLKDAHLIHTLPGNLLVTHGVTRPRVQLPVMTSGCPGSQLATLNQRA